MPASKFGLRGMTDSVRRELIGTGISVVPRRYRAVALLATVLPAAIDRQFAGTAGGAPPPPMRVAKVAQLVQKARQKRQTSDSQAPGR